MDSNDYIFGIRPVMEAIEADRNIDKILVRRDIGGDLLRELIQLANAKDVVIQKVPLEKLNRITRKNHQGVIAFISPVEYPKLENIIPLIYEEGRMPMAMILDGITDSRNFGAIARSAECAGVDFLIIPQKGSASVTSDAVRASAGALFHLPVCRVKDLKKAITELKENGYKIVGASEKGSVNYTQIDYNAPVAVVMGSEDTGISPEIIRICDELAFIPIKGNIGSLNVSVAAGVFMYEVVRQRNVASGVEKS